MFSSLLLLSVFAFFFFSLCQIDNATVILDEEPDVGSGMAAALKLAMSKGYLEKEEKKRIVISKSAQELQAQRYTIEDLSLIHI